MNKENFKNPEARVISGEEILKKIKELNPQLGELLEKIYKKVYKPEKEIDIDNYQKITEEWEKLDENTKLEIKKNSLAFHYLFGSSVTIKFVENYNDEPEAMNEFIERLKEVLDIS